MAIYLPPTMVSEIFNIDDYTYQDGYIIYEGADLRYLRPIQNLQQKTSGMTYNDTTKMLNMSLTW
jgi:hypothetical protein